MILSIASVLFQLLFDPLNGIVDGFGAFMEYLPDLLIGKAPKIQFQRLLFQLAQPLVDIPCHGLKVLTADQQSLRIHDFHAGYHIQQGFILLRLEGRTVQ